MSVNLDLPALAPVMLKALKLTETMLVKGTMNITGVEYDRMVTHLQNVIAKAEGQDTDIDWPPDIYPD